MKIENDIFYEYILKCVRLDSRSRSNLKRKNVDLEKKLCCIENIASEFIIFRIT